MRALLLAAAGLVGACATPAQPGTERGASLISADWRGYEEIPTDCPAGHICMHSLVDGRLREVRTLAGPQAPSRLTLRTWIHGDPRSDLRLVLVVRPPSASEPYWRGVIVDGVAPGTRACVDTRTLNEYGISPPLFASEEEDLTCFDLPRDAPRRAG